MVKALRPLIERAAKVAENEPDARRKHDTKAFHTLVSPLSVNGQVHAAKITVREALMSPDGKHHKFYDITALEIEDGPEVSGVATSVSACPLQPTPSEPLPVSVRKLASAVKDLDIESTVSKAVGAALQALQARV